MTRNEARETLGLPQMEEADDFLELNARQSADATANTQQTRQRDAERSSNSSDNTATVAGRNPKGEGRSVQ
jgi:hypothetical protein